MIASMNLGAVFPPRAPIASLPAFAERIDALNLDELWLAEDCFAHGGISAAAAALVNMRRPAVGVGLLPASLRNPALTAMELATLANLFPGRIRAALGHGVEAWMTQIGARPANRVTLLHDVADAVNRLLQGQEVTSRTEYVTLDRVALDQPPEVPPELFIGTTGPQSVAIVGEVGLGLLLPEGAGPAAVSWARTRIPPTSPVTVYSWLSIDEDRQTAIARLAPYVEQWRQMNLYSTLARLGGVSLDEPLPRDALASMAVVGTAAECARALEALGDAGAGSVALVPATEFPLEMLGRFTEEVVPLLLSRRLSH
jgi:5,10-methylenetetrahydromethanopterin reductase